MSVLAVHRASHYLSIDTMELTRTITECRDLSGTDKRTREREGEGGREGERGRGEGGRGGGREGDMENGRVKQRKRNKK